MYADGNGLYLKIEKSGAKRWVQRLVIRGRRTDLGLGAVSLVPLAAARAQALENRKIARAGRDPVQERRRANAVPTFDSAVEDYLEIKLAEFRNDKHRKQWRSSLDTYASPVIGALKVSDITLRDVLRVLEPIWSDKTETASRLRGRIEAVLAWATVAGHREGDNPARWKGNLDQMLAKPSKVAKTGNHGALSPDDAARWWGDLQGRSGMAAQALRFLALTVARSGEVRGMTWDEVDLDKALWTVPAERMKAGREHRVPLTGSAVSLLSALPRMKASPYVFFAPRGGMLSDMSISAVMQRMQAYLPALQRGGPFDPNAKPRAPARAPLSVGTLRGQCHERCLGHGLYVSQALRRAAVPDPDHHGLPYERSSRDRCEDEPGPARSSRNSIRSLGAGAYRQEYGSTIGPILRGG